MEKVSIIIPTIRLAKAKRCATLARQNAGISPSRYEIIIEEDANRIGAPKMVKRLTDKSRYDIVCFLGDDTLPQKDFLKIALAEMAEFQDGWGLVGLPDGTGRNLPTHWLVHKVLLSHLDGEFFHTGYKHCFCDNELMHRATEINRYKMAWDALVKHEHPLLEGKQLTGDYARVYSDGYMDHDRKLFYQRKRSRWGKASPDEIKFAIGWPHTGWMTFFNFLVSWTLIEKPNYTLLIPKQYHPEDEGEKKGIAEIRNDLVTQALENGCTHILMMDTDQTYPPDTILKLLSHNQDIVGALVHRRYPPFDAILYRGELGKYTHVSDEEIYSDNLVEVSATGTGCMLINMKVFDKLKFPWFEIRQSDDGKPIGEDIWFCHCLKNAGFKIYVDTSIQCEHLTLMGVTRETYELYRKLNPYKWAIQE